MRTVSKEDFIKRFSYWEIAAITGARDDPRVYLMLEKLWGAENIDLDDPELDKDLSVLVGLNLISEERKKEILK